MANSTITADLPRRVPRLRRPELPASQRCIGLLNGEASYPGKGCASDITYYYMAFVMADGTVRMSGNNNNNELAMEGNAYNPKHLHYLVWDNRTDADHPVAGRPLYVVGSYSAVAMLTDDGDVVAWGHNGHGQQGRGHTTGNGIARSIDASDIGRASGIPGRDVVKLDLVRGYSGQQRRPSMRSAGTAASGPGAMALTAILARATRATVTSRCAAGRPAMCRSPT